MFAVLKTGGKQYRVQSGDVLRVEKLAADAGEKIQFNDILMVNSTVGAPFVAGAAVQAEVIDTIKADKVITYHKRRRKHSSQRTKGLGGAVMNEGVHGHKVIEAAQARLEHVACEIGDAARQVRGHALAGQGHECG